MSALRAAPAPRARAVFRLRKLVKTRDSGGASFRLVVPHLDVCSGERLALVGESGCGKSTLLDLLAMVLQPSGAGTFDFLPTGDERFDVDRLWQRRARNELGALRRRHIGYVLQTGGLLPFVSVRRNIELSRRLLRMRDDGTVGELARQLGIERELRKLPGLLSVGQRQRVAIARALAHRPSIVIADEPTASVDGVTSQRVMSLFLEAADSMGATVIVATHNPGLVRTMGLVPLVNRQHGHADGTIESTFSRADDDRA